MKIKLDKQAFNQGLERLKLEYKILAPVTTPFKGTYSETDLTKYEEIENIEDIEFNKKSNFSAKETILPINQVLFYFTEKEFKTSDIDDKKLYTFHKFLRSNPIFPPYYAAVDFEDSDLVGPMYDGRTHKTYGVHDRYETQEMYDRLSN